MTWDGGTKDTRSAQTVFGGDLKAAMAARGLPLEKRRVRIGGQLAYAYDGIALKDRAPVLAQQWAAGTGGRTSEQGQNSLSA